MAVQLVSIAVVVVSNILLTWWLGDVIFARYSFVISWMQLLTNIALFGLQDYVLKELGVLAAQPTDRLLAVSLVRQVLGNSLLTAFLFAFLFVFAAFSLQSGQLHENRYAVLVGAPTIILFVYIFQLQAIVRTWRTAVWSLLSEKLVRPFFVCLVAGFFFSIKQSPTVVAGVGWATCCTLLAAAFSTFVLFYKTDLTLQDIWRKPERKFQINRKEQLDFLLLSIIGIAYIRIDTLFLGELGYINDVGVYNVATRFTDLIGFAMQTLSFVLTATYALYFKNEQLAKLQNLVTQSNRIIFAITCLLFIVIIVFGKFFLGIHSEGFIRGYPVVLVLGSVQLISAFCGDNNAILSMCGYGRQAFWCLLAGFLVAICLELLLIPPYGMWGAVLGRGIGSVIMYLGCAVMLWHKTGLKPTILGLKFKK